MVENAITLFFFLLYPEMLPPICKTAPSPNKHTEELYLNWSTYVSCRTLISILESPEPIASPPWSTSERVVSYSIRPIQQSESDFSRLTERKTLRSRVTLGENMAFL